MIFRLELFFFSFLFFLFFFFFSYFNLKRKQSETRNLSYCHALDAIKVNSDFFLDVVETNAILTIKRGLKLLKSYMK